MAEVPTLVFTDLPAATASPLNATEIHGLLTLWGGTDALLWRDIEVLAAEFMAVAHREDSEPRRRLWHHLLMAVGNFKRDPGRRIRTVFSSAPSSAMWEDEGVVSSRPDSFIIPGTMELLECDEASTWSALGRTTKGLGGVPTATTLLSALWPGRHVILDSRDMTASLGMLIGRDWVDTDRDGANFPIFGKTEWNFYQNWLRSMLVNEAPRGLRPVDVERALFLLDERAAKRLRKMLKVQWSDRDPLKWRWSDYRPVADAILSELADNGSGAPLPDLKSVRSPGSTPVSPLFCV